MTDGEEEKSKIDSIKDALYSRNTDNLFAKRRHDLSQRPEPIQRPSAWGTEESAESHIDIPYSKILFGAFVFFVLAFGFAFYKFFIGSNTVSGDNIDIVLSGPSSVSGGDELPITIQVKNNNNIALQTVDLHVEYPDGTQDPTDTSKPLKRFSEILGDIGVGQSVTRIEKSVLFGEEHTQKIVTISVEYRIAGSNAIFNKTKDYTVLLNSSPINIKVSGPSEVNANQQTDFSINLTSNSLATLKNLMLKVEYPFGFNLVSANPKPIASDGTLFAIGDLAPGGNRSIRITGTIAGQDGEERDLKFIVGTPSADDPKVIGTPYAIYTNPVAIKKPFIGLTTVINQNQTDTVAIPVGGKIHTDMTWNNNLADKVYNMSIKVLLKGAVLDQSSINVSNGFYNSVDNSITFDKNNNPSFATVNPSDQGDTSFDFGTLVPAIAPNVSFGNAKILMDIKVYGSKIGNNGSQDVLFADTKTLQLSSNLKLLSRGFRTVGPFENSGPFPPKANSETTYTITWTATDSFNNIDNAQVSGILPPGVTWKGFTSPDSENISYDAGRGMVVWNIGNIKSDTGNTNPPRDVSFQVGITPSITQVGAVLNLLNEATISGIDDFSGERVGEVKPPVTTNITSDPAYVEDVGKVTK